MGKVYKSDIGTEVILNCGMTITGATNLKIKYKKPGGTIGEWAAMIDGTTNVKRVMVSGDLDEAGVYKVQASLTLGTWSGRGETAEFTVYDYFG